MITTHCRGYPSSSRVAFHQCLGIKLINNLSACQLVLAARGEIIHLNRENQLSNRPPQL